MLLSSSYNHETLSGDCFEESSPGGGAAQQMSMQEPQMKPCVSDSGAPPRQLRIKPQPNQVLKCPRCNSLNTKFCYYNNYSLTQPRHFCKNCRRYWTKGGALRNVPVGGGCRKNKRAKQKNSDQSTASQQSDKAAAVNPHAQFEPRHHAQQLLASSSSLYDLAKEDDLGLPYGRIPHLRLGPVDSATSSGLTFEIPRPGAFNSLPLNLPPGAFEPAATLNFQGLMKHENTGEFAPIYDPSLNLLGGPGPSVSAAAPDTLGSFNINLGLENFVGLGLNGDLKWRQQQQHKVPGMIGDGDSHQHVFHLDEDRRTKGKVLSEQETGMNSGEWQQQQEQSFVEQPEAATYWSTTGTWPVDLPIYMDQQYCDVKPVDQHGVPDFYSRTAARCTPSLT